MKAQLKAPYTQCVCGLDWCGNRGTELLANLFVGELSRRRTGIGQSVPV